ncbi:hypothetical protein FA15DRAFT_671086 [Coprinopsis marcescibilis]|uniref:Sulfate transporter family protein n=1 Tax=Coprinopsis marcescibilis TaxID=230819 RepID=A0A5C3KQL1_COPMA|nr:hypothetical protein FA15DRAFT_671086 [Coprinopsis marcescibilis]
MSDPSRILHPRSYNVPGSLTGFMTLHNFSHPQVLHTHSQETIRQITMELSSMPAPGSFRSPPSFHPDRTPVIPEGAAEPEASGSEFIFPVAPHYSSTDLVSSTPSELADSISSLTPSISSATTTASSRQEDHDTAGQPLPQPQTRKGHALKPSGLSLLRPHLSSSLSSSSSLERDASSTVAPASEGDANLTPMGTPRPLPSQLEPTPAGRAETEPHSPIPVRGRQGFPSSLSRHSPSALDDDDISDESTPLLQGRPFTGVYNATPPDTGIPPAYLTLNAHKHAGPEQQPLDARFSWQERWKSFQDHVRPSSLKRALRRAGGDVKSEIKKLDPLSPTHLKTAVSSIPAILLGCLLNILDGVSYGMIIFPATGVFTDLGAMGVSMFFVSAIVAQLVYTFGGSGFAGGNGSMMIEVVPFFHILANSIAAQIGEDRPRDIIATTLVAYAFSSILTGVTFFLLGALKLGVLVGFFPRHILVGCIGGVGVFLIITGFAVSMRISDDEFTMTWETLRFMFLETHNLILWASPMALAILLRLITHKFHHQLIFPLYFIAIPLIFYVVVAAGQMNLGHLRTEGWLFNLSSTAHEPWYHFYSYFDHKLVHYDALWTTLPTQFALLFFNILHPPLNVPALAVSLDMDVDTDKELVAHGYSNLLSGLIGSVPNYLVYVNTLLFYRVGGDSRISGFLLAVATFGLLVIGTGPISYLPVMVVGALIFVLGIDLVKEALWDTRHRVSRSEYITIVSIMVCMTVWDFVIGVLFGIVVSCFFFVVQNSHRRSIRAVFTGDTAMSAVRRPSLQRAYIHEVAKQTTILRLQGFLFFGTITYVEEAIRELVSGPSYQKNPVRFLVMDFTMVAGVDMSSAEALVRVQRLLSAKHVTLVLCGFEVSSPIGKSLESVGLLGADHVELFATFNDAMEWTENCYLRAWYNSQKLEMTPASSLPMPSRREAIEYHHPFGGSFVRSPRRTHIRDAGDRTIATELIAEQEHCYTTEPLNTVIKAFSSYGTVDVQLFSPIVHYFERLPVPAGHVLWKQGEPSDGLYILESGILRAVYRFANSAQDFEESMVAGTVAGELSALADSPRNCTVTVEHAAVLWKLNKSNLQRLQNEQPELGRVFIQLVLKAAKIDYDILLTAIASRH